MLNSLIFSVFERFARLVGVNLYASRVRQPILGIVATHRPLRRFSVMVIPVLTITLTLILTPNLMQAQVPDGVYPNTVDAQGRKQGAWKKLDDQGTVIYVGQFKDDKPYGVFIYFDTEGFKMTEMNFGDGTTNVQRAKMFYIDGKLQAEGKYVNHLKDSVWRFYNMDGLFLSDENWVMGKREGKAITYHPGTNQPASITIYKNGLEDGPYVEYYLEGQKKMEATYVAGNMEGTATWFFEDGRINIIGAYQHAVKHGKWVYYNADGTIKGTETWNLGKLTSQEFIIKPEEMNKTIEDPQDPDHNRGAEGGGGN